MKQLMGMVIGLIFITMFLSSGGSSPTHAVVSKTISGTTGMLFKMKKFREFPMQELRKSNTDPNLWLDDARRCKQWAVSTTIWEPSKTLQQMARLKSWCIVVVLDKKTPVPFLVNNAVVLGVEDQKRLPYRIVRRLPWNHFGRKNIGFLYAVHHGAEVVYDLDDDNELLYPDDQQKYVSLTYVVLGTVLIQHRMQQCIHSDHHQSIVLHYCAIRLP